MLVRRPRVMGTGAPDVGNRLGLLSRMSGVDATSLPAAFVAYYDELLTHVSRKVSCPTVARDIVHEAYLRIAKVDPGQKVDNPRAFLHRIVGNLAIDYLRRETRRKSFISPTPPSDAVSDDLPSAEATLAAKQRVAQLQAIVDELPPRCREVFVMRKFEDMDHDEIAARLGISRNMVTTHIRNALLYCARRLSDQD